MDPLEFKLLIRKMTLKAVNSNSQSIAEDLKPIILEVLLECRANKDRWEKGLLKEGKFGVALWDIYSYIKKEYEGVLEDDIYCAVNYLCESSVVEKCKLHRAEFYRLVE